MLGKMIFKKNLTMCFVFLISSLILRSAQAQMMCEELFNDENAQIETIKLNFSNLAEVTEKTKEIYEEVTRTCKFGAGFCVSLALKTPGIAARVVFFKGTFSSLREGLVLPLADHIYQIKNSKLSQKERDKAYQNFLIFWPEMILKINRAIPTLASEVSINAATGLINFRTVEKNSALKNQVALRVLKNIWREIKNSDPELSFSAKLNQAILKSTADASSEVLAELGIPELQAALAQE